MSKIYGESRREILILRGYQLYLELLKAGRISGIIRTIAMDRSDGTPYISAPTPRELEIIQLIVDGHTTSEIAEILFISKQTVKTHRQNIYSKIGVNKAAQLVRLAFKQGWVSSN